MLISKECLVVRRTKNVNESNQGLYAIIATIQSKHYVAMERRSRNVIQRGIYHLTSEF